LRNPACGEGCNDAGTGSEPHTNFAEMAFYQAIPNNAPQHAQAAKRKAIPKPKQRSALYLWWNGHHEEMDYQAAVAAEESLDRADAIADASELVLVGGRTVISGTWAVRAALGGIATGGLGAPVAGLLIGMYPGKLNDGEQDFIDRMRAEQMREALPAFASPGERRQRQPDTARLAYAAGQRQRARSHDGVG
jgi:hypothetical protein